MSFAAVEYPPIENLVEWPSVALGFNKIALIGAIAFVVPAVLFLLAGRQRSLVPRGVQGFAESILDFVENNIAKPGIGHGYQKYVPLLTTLFVFISIGNVFKVVPFFQMPMNGRMGPAMVYALTVLVVVLAVGLRHHGLGYLKEVAFPPGIPKGLYVIVTPIEILSTFIVRPFSHAVRLFANMLAGHILLVTFSVLCISVWTLQSFVFVIQPVTFLALVVVVAFEMGVSFMQAFVFSILAAVYIGGALHPSH